MTGTVILAKRSLLHAAFLVLAAGDEGSTRRRVFTLVQRHPGLHQSELARQLGISEPAAEHHLHHLTRAGLLQRAQEGRFVRYFAAVQGTVAAGAVPSGERKLVALLRQAKPLEIVANLLQEDWVTMGSLARRVALSPGAVTYQVRKLEAVGVVERVPAGPERRVRLVDRARLIEVLLAYEPPADLVAGFESLWDDVGL
ncbi:MAG: winged helix-turn-helix transcriptional regulator [Thermoplasmatota archaeon]